MAVVSEMAGRGHGKRRSLTALGRVGGDVGSVADGHRQAGSGMASSRARARVACSGPGPAPWKMQSESARRAGKPSGHREKASPQSLGGHQLLAQTDARCPTGQRLCAIACTASQASLAAKRPERDMAQPERLI